MADPVRSKLRRKGGGGGGGGGGGMKMLESALWALKDPSHP